LGVTLCRFDSGREHAGFACLCNKYFAVHRAMEKLITIREVPFGSAGYAAVLAIREVVLRAPIGMVNRAEDVALDHTELHIAAFDGEAMVGCVLLRPLDAQVVKLRQMAVLDTYQGRGIGAQLVQFAEALAALRGFKKIEANARETAIGFYEKLGYRGQGETFIEVALPTLKMHKQL
jgi:GNAT superfamily N-acetyltransferase